MEDIVMIHTDGLEEEIRCMLCTNQMKTDRGCDGSCDIDSKTFDGICKIITNRIENKYAWHDLRKNPDDLPKQNKSVIFATSDGSVQEGEWNSTYWIQYRWSTYRNNSEVIAWRIERFEEEEK